MAGPRLSPADVVYIYAEGARGLKKRIAAWRAKHPDADLGRFKVLPRPLDMLSAEDVKNLVQTIRQTSRHPRFIIIDTLARCFGGGDENTAKDMNNFVGSCDTLRVAFPQATVLVVHHPGKNRSRGDRGSYVLRAACDTVIELRGTGRRGVTLRCEKQKDWEPFEDLLCRLDVVDLEDGETSCVVESVEAGHEKPAPKGNVLTTLTILASFEEGGATATDWKEKFMEEAGISETVFYRALANLQEGGYVTRPGDSTKGEHYSLTEQGREAVTVK